MSQPVGIRSLALTFPSVVRTNDYWREKYPELVAQAEEQNLAKLFSANNSTSTNEFTQAMMPYMKDPFRGSEERRVLGPGDSSLSLEYRAACDALKAANMSIDQVDLMLVASIFPEEIAPGNASFLSHKLGYYGPAWNVEATCSSAMVAIQTANAMVKSGLYHNVLVVVSNTYTRFTDERDSLSWFIGDAGGAVLVGKLKANQGVLGTKILNTGNTCGAFFTEFIIEEQNKVKMFIRAGNNAGKVLSESSNVIRTCCEGAVAEAGLTLDKIDFFAFNSPTAWYVDVCARKLNIDPQRTINLHSQYANIGAVLPLANLYHATHSGKLRENDLVLIYTLGTSSNVGAMVMRWGDVALGVAPTPSETLMKAGV
ncbi:MAG: 3-oxoacyl-ACP synthase III family protein [Cyanobacteriota bacterium]|nr:3-oxoacyl-ACP synthase III family protein [Cyanobacteriota bacterium]